MSCEIIFIGETKKIHIEMTYVDEDGKETGLPIEELSFVEVDVKQFGKVLATLKVLPTPDPGMDYEENTIIVEINSELSAKLKRGPLYVRVRSDNPDSDFSEGLHKDIEEKQIADVLP